MHLLLIECWYRLISNERHDCLPSWRLSGLSEPLSDLRLQPSSLTSYAKWLLVCLIAPPVPLLVNNIIIIFLLWRFSNRCLYQKAKHLFVLCYHKFPVLWLLNWFGSAISYVTSIRWALHTFLIFLQFVGIIGTYAPVTDTNQRMRATSLRSPPKATNFPEVCEEQSKANMTASKHVCTCGVWV